MVVDTSVADLYTSHLNPKKNLCNCNDLVNSPNLTKKKHEKTVQYRSHTDQVKPHCVNKSEGCWGYHNANSVLPNLIDKQNITLSKTPESFLRVAPNWSQNSHKGLKLSTIKEEEQRKRTHFWDTKVFTKKNAETHPCSAVFTEQGQGDRVGIQRTNPHVGGICSCCGWYVKVGERGHCKGPSPGIREASLTSDKGN